MRRLLAPDGCPWDREQSFESLRKYVLEEACEVIDAIDSGDRKALREELGRPAPPGRLPGGARAARGGASRSTTSSRGIVDKLVHRHPHVFGDLDAKDADEVLRNWEKHQGARRRASGGILGGVPRSLPALTRAQRIGEKVSRVGFDWEDAAGSRAKVAEEIGELERGHRDRQTRTRIEEEMGDVLFALVNLSRHVDVDAEGALRRTIDKFTRALRARREARREKHGGWGDGRGRGADLPLAVLDGYWEEAKDGEGR